MPIRYPEVLQLPAQDTCVSWEARDLILYALAVGMADEPLDERQKRFVSEESLVPLPSYATVLARPAAFIRATGVEFSKVVLAQLQMTLHEALPSSGSAVLSTRLRAVFDKGERGALLATESTLSRIDNSVLIATVSHVVMARADGNFSGPTEPPATYRPPSTTTPLDVVLRVSTCPNQAALYRLCGDLNPMHIDPKSAQAAGFPRPILHGLCTYAIAYRAILQTFCAYDPQRIRSFGVQFSAPLFPGEALDIHVSRQLSTLHFSGRVAARGVEVLRDGVATLN